MTSPRRRAFQVFLITAALGLLGVARGNDDARADAGARPARLHVDEVEGELGVVVVQEDQVRVGPLGRGLV